MATNDGQQPLHVLFFPFLAPGHLIPVADMAALFASHGVKSTILTTPVNAAVIRSAVDRANGAFRGTDAPAIDISTVPFPDVGLPPGVESVVSMSSEADVYKLMEAFHRLREPFDRFLAEHLPDAAVADSFFPWAADVVAKHGVPRLCFLGTSMFARACTDTMVRNNPLKQASDGSGPNAVVSLPGLPHHVALMRSQLMDPMKDKMEWDYYELVNTADQRSYGEVFNSFAELELDYVEHYRTTLDRRVWLLGPLAHASKDMAARGGLSPDGERCLKWLDEKPARSVVYVSFGTLTHFSAAEMGELARGLLNSYKNFLWVIGGEETDASQWMPEGFAQQKRGLIFHGWAPQMLILNHPAVGCLVTHCGWNSVLEAISAGVPLVTWPRYADQYYNEKLVVEVLKIGISLGASGYGSKLQARDRVVSGETIAEAIQGVMGQDPIRRKAKELSEKAKRATEKGGSSYGDLEQLIHELMTRRSSDRV